MTNGWSYQHNMINQFYEVKHYAYGRRDSLQLMAPMDPDIDTSMRQRVGMSMGWGGGVTNNRGIRN